MTEPGAKNSSSESDPGTRSASRDWILPAPKQLKTGIQPLSSGSPTSTGKPSASSRTSKPTPEPPKKRHRRKATKIERIQRDLLVRNGPGDWRPSEEVKGNAGVQRACSLFAVMETQLQIVTKKGKRVPFHFNAAQIRLAQHVAWRWSLGLPVYCLIPKARQMGISTFWQGVFFVLCCMSEVYRAATVAHTEDGAGKIFSISKTYMKHWPGYALEPLENDQQSQFVWEKGSRLAVYSVKIADALGKGGTENGVHFSEAANFGDKGLDPSIPWSSLQNGVHKDENTIVAVESTAKGRDVFFYGSIMESLEGKSHYVTLFFPWHLMPEYRMSWEHYRLLTLANPAAQDPGEEFQPTLEEIRLRDKLAKLVVTEENKLYTHRCDLTDEQLIWRRFKIQEDCKGKIDLFHRYYPSTLDECFSSTETTLFTPQAIDYYKRNTKKPELRGVIHRRTGRPAFVPSPNGPLLIWEQPIPGEDYVIGADVAEGRVGRDYNVAVVMNKATKRVVAVFRDLCAWDHYVETLFALGWWYYHAMLAVENNYNPAVANKLATEGYPRVYHYYDEAALRGTVAPRPGWNTNRKTRNPMISTIGSACRDGKLVHPHANFAAEMADFVWRDDLSPPKYAARRGKHDDEIIATAIALEVAPDEKADEIAEMCREDPVLSYFNRLKKEHAARGDDREGVLF